MTPFIVLMLVMLIASAFLLRGAPNPTGQADKLGYLEGVRGAAAFMVVLFHFIMVFYPAMMTGQPGDSHHPVELLFATTPLFSLYSGTFFVALFFVLSGFVLSYRFLVEKKREIVFSSACRRYLRLAYPVLFTTAFYCLLILGGMLSMDEGNRLALVTHSKYIINLFNYTPSLGGMLHDVLLRLFFIFYENKYNYALWTMGFEFIGSFLLYICLLTLGNAKYRWWGYAAYSVLISALFKTPQLLAFMSGMMLCDLYVNGYLTRLRHPAFKGLLLILGFYLAGYNINLTPDQIEGGAYSWVLATLSLTKNLFFPGWLVVIAGATLLLTLVINSTILQKLFASRLGKFMGKISFSVYLIHYSVLLTLGFNLFWRWQGLYGYHLAVLLSLTICLPVIIALSYLVYLTVDRASHQLGKNFYRAVVQKSLAAINWTALSHRCSLFFIKLRPVRIPQQEETLHG